MAEPSYEELKARLAELEKQGTRRTGQLDFRVGEKGGVSVYGFWMPAHSSVLFLRRTKPPANSSSRKNSETLLPRRPVHAGDSLSRCLRVPQTRLCRSARRSSSIKLGARVDVLRSTRFRAASCARASQSRSSHRRKSHRRRENIFGRMRRVPRRRRQAGSNRRQFVSTDSAASGGGHHLHGGTNFLGCQARHPVLRHVRQRQVGFRPKTMDCCRVH